VASLTFVSDGHLSHGHLSPMHLSSQHLSLQHIERMTAAFIAWQQPDKLKTHMAARAGKMVFIMSQSWAFPGRRRKWLRKIGPPGFGVLLPCFCGCSPGVPTVSATLRIWGAKGVSFVDRDSWNANDASMCRPIVTFLFSCLIAVSILSPATADDTDEAIVQAATRYVLQETGVADLSIAVEEIEGQFARVSVASLSGKTDTAIAFLKRSDGEWKVLSIGTLFFPDDLAELGIPASLAD